MYHESLVKPKITGLAYVTGYNQIVLDDHDPFQGRAPSYRQYSVFKIIKIVHGALFKAGFTVGDIWA